ETATRAGPHPHLAGNPAGENLGAAAGIFRPPAAGGGNPPAGTRRRQSQTEFETMNQRTRKLALPWLLLLAVTLLAAWLRYGVIEPGSMAQQCGAGAGPWWCSWRHALVLGFLYDVYGIAALLAAAVALWRKHSWLAWLGAALGIVALQLYCFESGA